MDIVFGSAGPCAARNASNALTYHACGCTARLACRASKRQQNEQGVAYAATSTKFALRHGPAGGGAHLGCFIVSKHGVVLC